MTATAPERAREIRDHGTFTQVGAAVSSAMIEGTFLPAIPAPDGRP